MPLLRSLRPRQWAKNTLVLTALIFAGSATDPMSVARALGAMLLFCAAASGLYLINDLSDVERDRLHPSKRTRPIASGALGASTARAAAVALLGPSLILGFLLSIPFGLALAAYAGMTLAYSAGLKHVAIADVFVLASGFVLRVVAGALVLDLAVSDWLLICALQVSLFMALCKRRHELGLLGGEAIEHRAALAHYSPGLLDQMIAIITSAILVSYSLYTLWPDTVAHVGSTRLKYSIPFVMLGVFRYLQLVYVKDEGGAPERVLTDRGIVLIAVCWAASVAAVIYGH